MINTSGKGGKGTQPTPVTVSREVAEAIKFLISTEGGDSTPHNIVAQHASDSDTWLAQAKALNGLPLDTLIRALYIGYEVEKSPEEKLSKYIEDSEKLAEFHADNGTLDEFFCGRKEGARKAAEILGVTFPDINGGDAN